MDGFSVQREIGTAYTKSPKLQMRECMRVRNVFITKVVSIEDRMVELV